MIREVKEISEVRERERGIRAERWRGGAGRSVEYAPSGGRGGAGRSAEYVSSGAFRYKIAPSIARISAK